MKYLITEQQLESIYPIINFSEELKNFGFNEDEIAFINTQINKSDLKKIYFYNFSKASGFAFDNETIIFNKNYLRQLNKLDILFVIFHELSHLLQYKKHGNDFALKVYKGEDLDDIDGNRRNC
jgi:hypothetical protein